jgi:DNA-directed RNA polymerase
MAMKAVIDASSDSDLWGALEQVINSENNLRLLLIVDGLEEAETHNDKIIEGIRLFIKRLQGKVNALLTSRPEDDIKALLKGILSIEYDKERNGMTISPSVP